MGLSRYTLGKLLVRNTECNIKNKFDADSVRGLLNSKQRCTRGYKRYKETSGLIEWKECQIFHSIFT